MKNFGEYNFKPSDVIAGLNKFYEFTESHKDYRYAAFVIYTTEPSKTMWTFSKSRVPDAITWLREECDIFYTPGMDWADLKYESPDVDSDRIEMINKRIVRDTLNSSYGIVSRDWADVLADSARYIHMQQSRCGGKTMWLSNIAKSIEEDARNDAIERWLKATPITPMRYRGKTWTHPESIYGKQGHMLIVDISSKVFKRHVDYLDVEVDDVMLYDDGNNGKKEPDEHGKLFVWRGLGIGWQKLSDDNGYFDTDMAMTREEMQYCLNDAAVTEKLFKEEKVMRFDSCKPTIKKVIFNDPATIVMWSDGTKTVVKCGENDIFDPEKGVAMACMKKLLGTNKTGSNYLDKVQEYFDEYDGEQLEKCLAVRQQFMKFLAGCVKNGSNSKDIPPEVTVDKEFEAVTSDDWTAVPADENTTAEENGE